MSEESSSPTGSAAIADFYKRVREDSGIQGQIIAAAAEVAPDRMAEIAQGHGFQFTPDELTQVLEDRAVRSIQGEVFWSVVLANSLLLPRQPFGQISGPSWVQLQPYRHMAEGAQPSPSKSFADILSEVTDEKP
jgi:predicted ribosomally synthesized peptide with nif11-like leader